MPEIKYTPVAKAFNMDNLAKFVVVDVETTGLKDSTNRIIQLSAVKYIEWEPVECWSTYIHPKKLVIDPAAQKVNGITEEMLYGKPTIGQIRNSFIEFIGDFPVVGYNLPFDFKFIYAEGIDLTFKKRKYFDVYELAKKAYKKELDSFSLENVCAYQDIYYDAHNSLNDCFATGALFQAVITEITNA